MPNSNHCRWSSSIRWAVFVALWCLFIREAPAQAPEAKPDDGGPTKGEEKANAQPLPPREWPMHVDIPFSKGLDADRDLRFFGPDAADLAKVEPQGLRFTLPMERTNFSSVGVESLKILRGDFEITLGYELLAFPIPGPAGGAGAVLDARFDAPGSPSVRFGRTQKGNGAYFGSTYYILGKDGKQASHPLKYPKADEKVRTGRMRLLRTGTELAFQAEEGGAGFRTIATKEVGDADVVSVRAFATTSWKSLLVDLRFTNLALRWAPGTNIAAVPVANQPIDAQRPRGSRGWLAAGAIIGTLLVLSIAAALFIVRSRRKTDVARAPQTKRDAQS